MAKRSKPTYLAYAQRVKHENACTLYQWGKHEKCLAGVRAVTDYEGVVNTVTVTVDGKQTSMSVPRFRQLLKDGLESFQRRKNDSRSKSVG